MRKVTLRSTQMPIRGLALNTCWALGTQHNPSFMSQSYRVPAVVELESELVFTGSSDFPRSLHVLLPVK